jgi:hypothetical protein
MADNARFHNKYHRRNHHTLPSAGFPDSGSDPIASQAEPFQGSFYAQGSLSATNDLTIGGDALIYGNLSALGNFSVIDTFVTVTSALSVVNKGTGPAFTVIQEGIQDIAVFLDDTSNALKIMDGAKIRFFEEGSSGAIGINTTNLTNALTIKGSVSASGSLNINGSTTLGDTNADTNILRGIVKIADSSASNGILLGSGDASYDANLYRSTANTLKTDDNFIIDLDLNVNGNTTLGNANTDTTTINGTNVSIPNNLNIDSNTLYIDSTNDRVGIGTPTPAEKLTVFGNISSNGTLFTTSVTSRGVDIIHTPANDGVNPILRMGENSTTGGNQGFSGIFMSYNESTNTFGMSAEFDTAPGIPAISIDRNGRVGIGTDTPSASLTVVGTISGNNLTASFNAASATGTKSFAANEGYAFGDHSFAEGFNTIASGSYSHAQGDTTRAQGYASHASGVLSNATKENTTAIGVKANAVHRGAVVISTNTNQYNSSSFGDETFNVFASGGTYIFNKTTIGDPVSATSFVVTSGGLVGININVPSERLTVNGNISANGNLTIAGSTILGDSSLDTLTLNGTNVIIPNNLNFDANTLFIDAANNRVGIGTNTPEQALHVLKASAGAVTADAGSIAVFEGGGNNHISILTPDSQTGGLVFGSPADNYGSYLSWNHDNNALKLATANPDGYMQLLTNNEAEAVRITSSGNVGIGTTAPAEKLTVSGNISANGTLSATGTGNNYFAGNVGIKTSTPGEALTVSGNISANGNIIANGSLSATTIFTTGSGNVIIDRGNYRRNADPTIIIGANSDQHLRFRAGGDTNNEIRMTILSSGEVGIGTSVAETAAARLTVSGNISASGNLFINSISSRNIDMLHSPANDGTNPVLRIGEIDFATGNVGFSGAFMSYNESTNVFGISSVFAPAGGIPAISIDRFGKMGINTNSPTESLTVLGNISGNGGISVVSMQASNNVGVGAYAPLYFNLDVNGSTGDGSIGSSYGNLSFGSSSNILINPNNNLLLGPVGNVGIGTTVPAEKLTVSGNISASGSINAQSSNVGIVVDNKTTSYTFTNADNNRIVHFDTTAQSLCAIIPSSLRTDFNCAVMNTGTNILVLSTYKSLRATGTSITIQYGAASIYKDSSNNVYAVGRI